MLALQKITYLQSMLILRCLGVQVDDETTKMRSLTSSRVNEILACGMRTYGHKKQWVQSSSPSLTDITSKYPKFCVKPELVSIYLIWCYIIIVSLVHVHVVSGWYGVLTWLKNCSSSGTCCLGMWWSWWEFAFIECEFLGYKSVERECMRAQSKPIGIGEG